MTGVLVGIPGDWRHRARCTIEQAELFFPVAATDLANAQRQAAKAVCALCPVRVECLQWALEVRAEGIWGGTDEAERRQLRQGRTLARDRHGTVACYDANSCRCPRCRQAKAANNRRKRQRRTA